MNSPVFFSPKNHWTLQKGFGDLHTTSFEIPLFFRRDQNARSVQNPNEKQFWDIANIDYLGTVRPANSLFGRLPFCSCNLNAKFQDVMFLKSNIAPENGLHFQGRTVSSREGIVLLTLDSTCLF